MAKKRLNYEEYYETQSGQKRFRLNELTIWAVNKLCTEKANVKGSKDFLQGRLNQLVRDIRYEKWSTVNNRLRVAINQWIKSHSVGDKDT